MTEAPSKFQTRAEYGAMLAAALLLLVLALFSAHQARLSAGEGARYRAAPSLPDEGREVGELYRVSGPVTGPLLNPPDYWEVKDALLYRVSREVKDTTGEGWTRLGGVQTRRVDQLEVGGAPVAVSSASRLLIPSTEASRVRSGGERLALETVSASGLTAVAYGLWEKGALRDGAHDRLLLASATHEQEVLEMIEKTGRIKAVAFGLAAAALLVMAGFSIHTARRRLAP